MKHKPNQNVLLLMISMLILIALACSSGASSQTQESEVTERVQPQLQEITTEETEPNSIPFPTDTLEPTPTEKPSQTPEPSPTFEPSPTTEPTSTTEPTPTVEPLVDVRNILGKQVGEVEVILGPTVLISPNDDFDDDLAGGEYRDYEIGNYWVFVAYDSNGIARVFQVLDGLSVENYSITEWDQILPKFGLFLSSPPEREALAAVYWDNYDGYFIAVVASNTSGKPVWTVQISEAAYQP